MIRELPAELRREMELFGLAIGDGRKAGKPWLKIGGLPNGN
jgi:hypothetical protein